MKLSAAGPEDAKQPEFAFGNFRLWPDGTFLRGEEQIHLPPKELAALRFLLMHAGQVVTPMQVKQALWGDVHVTWESVPRCLSSLRNLLEPEQCIQTIYKRGYRLLGPVRDFRAENPRRLRLAVMPFTPAYNVSEHLAWAVADEITSQLTESGVSGISVLARDSVFTLAHRGLTAAEVGKALNADLVLSGTLLAQPTQYRLRMEIIRVADETQICVEDAVAAHGRLFELESRIVQRLLFRLAAGDMPDAAPAPQPAPPQADAYELFLRGHQEWQSHERHHMQDATQHLMQAAELDPSLFSAQIDLAELCVTQEVYGFLPPEEAARNIHRIAESIPDLVHEAPALLPILGWVKFHIDRDFPGALELFSTSAQLPHGGTTTRIRVMFALSRHRFDEALDWLESALMLDPYAPWVHAMRAWTLHLAGQGAKSFEAAEKTLQLFPDDDMAQALGALILAFQGHAKAAATVAQNLVRRAPFFDLGTAIHAYALACGGEREEAQRVLEQLQWMSRERYLLRSFTAAAFAALGATEEAIAELEGADAARCPWSFQTLADPRLETLHGHPRFEHMRNALESIESSSEESLEMHV